MPIEQARNRTQEILQQRSAKNAEAARQRAIDAANDAEAERARRLVMPVCYAILDEQRALFGDDCVLRFASEDGHTYGRSLRDDYGDRFTSFTLDHPVLSREEIIRRAEFEFKQKKQKQFLQRKK